MFKWVDGGGGAGLCGSGNGTCRGGSDMYHCRHGNGGGVSSICGSLGKQGRESVDAAGVEAASAQVQVPVHGDTVSGKGDGREHLRISLYKLCLQERMFI
jgi:hypothetical protein